MEFSIRQQRAVTTVRLQYTGILQPENRFFEIADQNTLSKNPTFCEESPLHGVLVFAPGTSDPPGRLPI